MNGDSGVEVRAEHPARHGLAVRPRLIVFHSPSSGRCRRTDGYLAQALQHRRNHDTFHLVRVNVDERPDLAERFRVDELPTLIVVEDRQLMRRIVSPRGCRELERELASWLR